MSRLVRVWPACLLVALAAAVPSSQSRSFVITGAQLADGTGGALRSGAVRVEGDTITAVGAVTPRAGETVVDGSGLVLAPGFIDAHNHSTEGLLKEPASITQVSQGITTLAVGQDGRSPWPLAGYFEKLSEGGTVVMPFGPAPWGGIFGMCDDKYGISWLINCQEDEPA